MLVLLLALVTPSALPDEPPPPSDSLADADCEPPAPGFLTLDTAPWTVVYVDGVYTGSTPLFKQRIAPGPHTLTLVNEEKSVLTHEDVNIEEGRARKLKLVLLLDEASPTIDSSADATVREEDCFIPLDEAANLTVDTQPWSKVYLDGRFVGSTPVFKQAIVIGDHVVRLVRDDGRAVFARFTATVGETVKLSFAL